MLSVTYRLVGSHEFTKGQVLPSVGEIWKQKKNSRQVGFSGAKAFLFYPCSARQMAVNDEHGYSDVVQALQTLDYDFLQNVSWSILDVPPTPLLDCSSFEWPDDLHRESIGSGSGSGRALESNRWGVITTDFMGDPASIKTCTTLPDLHSYASGTFPGRDHVQHPAQAREVKEGRTLKPRVPHTTSSSKVHLSCAKQLANGSLVLATRLEEVRRPCRYSHDCVR